MKSRFFGELLKWSLYPFTLPIKAGPLVGYKWIPSSGSRFLRGNYEPEKTEALCKMLTRGDIVLDIGAHVGYFSVLMSNLVGPTGQIFSFEPRGINFAFLKRHLLKNQCSNVHLIKAAVGNTVGTAYMDTRTGTGTGKLHDAGNLAVKIITVDGFYREFPQYPPPSFMKIDVEGAEFEVLKGAELTIKKFKPRIVLATHSTHLDFECKQWLTFMGYRSEAINQVIGDKETIFIHPANS